MCNVVYRDSFLTQVCQSLQTFQQTTFIKKQRSTVGTTIFNETGIVDKSKSTGRRPFLKKGFKSLKLLIEGAKKFLRSPIVPSPIVPNILRTNMDYLHKL